MNDFAAAFRLIDPDIPRIEHGRDFNGVDCVGLPMLIYRLAGHPIDNLDLPYRDKNDAFARHGEHIIRRQLGANFRNVTDQVLARLDHPGDIWLFEDHVGVQYFGELWHMTDRLLRRDVERIRPLLIRAYRL